MDSGPSNAAKRDVVSLDEVCLKLDPLIALRIKDAARREIGAIIELGNPIVVRYLRKVESGRGPSVNQ